MKRGCVRRLDAATLLYTTVKAMEPIFDSNGAVVSWLNGTHVHDLNGNPFAFIQNGAVYLYNAQQIGWLRIGYFRDGHGNAVAFLRKHSGGPLTPLPELPPLPPLPALPPLPPLPPLSPAGTTVHVELVSFDLG
jgi:hypothetical protein